MVLQHLLDDLEGLILNKKTLVMVSGWRPSLGIYVHPLVGWPLSLTPSAAPFLAPRFILSLLAACRASGCDGQ
jgi:hypothetical protein